MRCIKVVCFTAVIVLLVLILYHLISTSTLYDESNSEQELATMDPDELIRFERNNRYEIINSTVQFAKALKSCEAITIAAYEVGDYVPIQPIRGEKELWMGTIIPILVRALQRDVRARSEITRSFSSVRQLAIIIKYAYDIVRRSKGSKYAVEIAKRNIAEALETLDKCIERVEHLESYAINEFGNNTQKMFEIIGYKAGNFSGEKDEIDDKINKELKKQEELYSELGLKKGEVESNFFLIQAYTKAYTGVEVDVNETKRRIKELNDMNSRIEAMIQNIPEKINKTVTTSLYFGWWFWGVDWSSTTTTKVENPNREKDQRYYNDVIKARLERRKNVKQDQEDKEEALAKVKDNLVKYKETYEKSKKELNGLQSSFSSKFFKIQEEIEKLIEDKRRIEENEDDTIEKIGLQGKRLVECLTQIRSFSRSLKPGASAYSPLVSLLTQIKTMVKTQVQLLGSKVKSDVFLAATMLMEQVGFLSDYTIKAQQTMNPSMEYKAIEDKMNDKFQ